MASEVRPDGGRPASATEEIGLALRAAARDEAAATREIKGEQDRLAFGKPAADLEWDGIRKLDYPPPRWWVLTFWGAFVVAAIGWVLYPSWPGVTGYFPGLLNYQQRVEVKNELAAAEGARARFVGTIGAAPLEEIRADPQLLGYAVAAGRVVFNNNCAQCHALGGAGQGVFPTLADDDWLWGGRPEDIEHTITHGVRNGGEQARDSAMPRFGADKILTREQIGDVADYVLSLPAGTAATPGKEEAVGRGEALFAENCVACHGEGGAGMPEMGAPRLNDAIALYGGTRAKVVAQIVSPRHGVMPAFGTRLDPSTIRMLVAYVHGLGGGQ
jgi:cytochrome c oxidase cbb3-type subunit 3